MCNCCKHELLEIFDIPVEERNMPDSLLILKAYKKWRIKCPEYLIGDFAFTIWDKQKNELFCARDHVGKRSLYYYDSPDVFAFSTIIEPLFKCDSINKRLIETYIADFLALTSVRHELSDEMTIYEKIFNLPPACAMLVNKDGLKKWRYWEIRKTKELHFDTDAEYEDAFIKVYSEAVNCRLRSVKRVGMLLSGGLDSGSAACIAAPELKKRNEKLYSFTQVPMEGYMPDYVRLNTTIRGRQAADWMQRIAPEWNEAYKEMETIGDNGLERKYLDIPRIKRFLAANKELSPDDNDGTASGVRLLIRALIFTRFLRSFEAQT